MASSTSIVYLRVDSSLYEEALTAARSRKLFLTRWIIEAIREKLDRESGG